MTLLESTSHLIDIAKTFGRDDAITRRAVKRMEKRLAVLQLRSAKALRARRQSGWSNFILLYWGTFCPKEDRTKNPAPFCIHCKFDITFGDFVKNAVLTGRGHIKEFRCPSCYAPLIGWFDEDHLENPNMPRHLPPSSVFAEELKTASPPIGDSFPMTRPSVPSVL